MTASPERNRNARDAGSSVDASLRAADSTRGQLPIPASAAVLPTQLEPKASTNGREQKPSLLSLASFATTTAADISSVLAVIPFVLFTGPTQTDTAYSIVTPVAILCIAPLIGAALAAKLPASILALASSGARLAVASSLFGSFGGMETSAATIILSLALIWGFRLQEVSTSSLESTKSGKLVLCALPLLALMAVLKFFEPLQPMLMQSALTLYAIGLVALGLDQIIKRITTTGNTVESSSLAVSNSDETSIASNAPTPKAARTLAYEILVSTCAALLPVASVLLVITDQGLTMPILRNDVIASLGGFSVGAIATAIISQKYWFKITHLHIAFTLFLGVTLVSRTSVLALSALLFTSMIAGAITMTVNNTRWQKPLTMSVIVVVSYLSYLYLTPLQSTWMPIHALRMLAGNLLAVSAIALLLTARGRLTILAFVRRLKPRKIDGGAFDTSPARGLQ